MKTTTSKQLLAALAKLEAAAGAESKERRRPITPSDLQRLGELTTKHPLNANEKRALEILEARFDFDRLRRDKGGSVYRTPDGKSYAAGVRRTGRELKAQRWIIERLAPDAKAHQKRRAQSSEGGKKAIAKSIETRSKLKGGKAADHLPALVKYYNKMTPDAKSVLGAATVIQRTEKGAGKYSVRQLQRVLTEELKKN